MWPWTAAVHIYDTWGYVGSTHSVDEANKMATDTSNSGQSVRVQSSQNLKVSLGNTESMTLSEYLNKYDTGKGFLIMGTEPLIDHPPIIETSKEVIQFCDIHPITSIGIAPFEANHWSKIHYMGYSQPSGGPLFWFYSE